MFVGDVCSGEYKKWKRGVRSLRWAESVDILNTVIRKAPGQKGHILTKTLGRQGKEEWVYWEKTLAGRGTVNKMLLNMAGCFCLFKDTWKTNVSGVQWATGRSWEVGWEGRGSHAAAGLVGRFDWLFSKWDGEPLYGSEQSGDMIWLTRAHHHSGCCLRIAKAEKGRNGEDRRLLHNSGRRG